MKQRSLPGRALWGAALLLPALVWGLCVFRAHHHFRLGREAQEARRTLEAGREYQSAIGYYAPLNPWSRAGAEALAAMVNGSRSSDPDLAFELEDRLRRSIRGTRWLVQPYAGILARTGGPPADVPRDPDPRLFFLSLAGLGVVSVALGLPRKGMIFRAALVAAGLGLWAIALRFC
jgi:hypothetical protein